MSQLRAAIAGTGFTDVIQGRSARLAGVRLVGVAAFSPERSALAARELGAESAFESAEGLVELAEDALRADKRVVCEKPLALDTVNLGFLTARMPERSLEEIAAWRLVR